MTNEFTHFIKYLLEQSAKVITKYYRRPLKIELKSDDSPVTIADKNAEERLRELIRRHYPDDGIIGEEFEAKPAESDYTWVLDPIDGTKSFLCGTPLFGTLIALLQNNIPIIGAIGFPVLQQILVGNNKQTTLNDEVVRMRECSNLSEAILLTTDHLYIKKYQDINSFNTLLEKVRLYRTWGDCYGYNLLASGFADIMIDPIVSIWDSMAIIPIIKGAGGIITDYQGNDPLKGSDLIAANKKLHLQIISLLNSTD